MEKSVEEANALIKLIEKNQSWSGEREKRRSLQPSTGKMKSVVKRAYEELLMDKLDAIQRRLDKNYHIPEETIKLAESRSTCEECVVFGHVSKDCPEDAKMPSFVKNQGWRPPYQSQAPKPSFTLGSSMQNAIPLRFQ